MLNQRRQQTLSKDQVRIDLRFPEKKVRFATTRGDVGGAWEAGVREQTHRSNRRLVKGGRTGRAETREGMAVPTLLAGFP